VCERPYRLRVLHLHPPQVRCGLIRLPKGLRFPYNFSLRLRLPAHGSVVDKDPMHLPTAGTLRASQVPGSSLHTHRPNVLRDATLFVDPGRPSESSPIRSLCVGFSHRTLGRCGTVTPSPPALFSVTRLYQDFRDCGLPYGLCGSLCTLQLSCSAFASSTTATLGTGGWLGLTQKGLSPCKKRQASWRTTASS
jgi:hypothetical protein